MFTPLSTPAHTSVHPHTSVHASVATSVHTLRSHLAVEERHPLDRHARQLQGRVARVLLQDDGGRESVVAHATKAGRSEGWWKGEKR